jgi:GH35 family endo-1,4-beta-xylanase
MPTIFGSNVIQDMPPTGPIRLWDCQTEWARIEKERGTFDWSTLDSFVAAAGKRSICLVIGHPPAWAALGGPDGKQAAWMPAGSNRPPANMGMWSTYVQAVVTRYKGRIQYYQVWNEPADKRFYSGDYATMGTITKTAYQIIKRIDPAAKVVSYPLQPRRQAGFDTKGAALLSSLKSAGYPCDVYAMHIYPQQSEGVEGFTRDCKIAINALAKAPKKPLWITETNYNLGGKGNPYAIPDQIKLMSETNTICNMLDIDRCFWYAYHYNNPSLIAITNI